MDSAWSVITAYQDLLHSALTDAWGQLFKALTLGCGRGHPPVYPPSGQGRTGATLEYSLRDHCCLGRKSEEYAPQNETSSTGHGTHLQEHANLLCHDTHGSQRGLPASSQGSAEHVTMNTFLILKINSRNWFLLLQLISSLLAPISHLFHSRLIHYPSSGLSFYFLHPLLKVSALARSFRIIVTLTLAPAKGQSTSSNVLSPGLIGGSAVANCASSVQCAAVFINQSMSQFSFPLVSLF